METMPPPQKKRRIADQHIPTELLEQILLNLPVKSLTRFSTVSKSWNSTIHSRDFARRYRGREMIVLRPFPDSDTALESPLSSIISGNPTASFPRPLPSSRVRASCGELWCVELEENSVCLYNPSMRTCRELPPASPTPINTPPRRIIYGLGYDSATDDYKVLKFDRDFTGDFELYSRRSNSWRMLGGSRENIRVCMSSPLPYNNFMDFYSSEKSVFVNGLLHWILIPHFENSVMITRQREFAILSFDLSTEKYEKVAMPVPVTGLDRDRMELGVSRGKLCVYIDDRKGRGVTWVHDEGVWSKEVVIYYYNHLFRTREVVINYSHIFRVSRRFIDMVEVKPLFSYNNNINAFVAPTVTKMFLFEEGSTQVVDKDFGCGELDSFTYVESMVEP